ncbi:hypothetical protein MATR_36430 [Marivirga tractuosa]|uniref:Peptidyl-prolyl cis-trans isomerase n=1 Tax=Marivirga tractuosa (strain ATCC 23168 / DSM 4126 / NBRC 15989 / NCIMB 1408 / VKM B-1430 / H-43) TaxID=643867 RepID=E4TNU7_MARTH|nr:FKBP-type peptidyl-prolyl cis-trans isomerase [Marivirga tractuosa]ADR22511.1 peptidylprolyl isomerase FKBP-type [Marivirga tractuosa DSM 4126]BDD16818.1 hypothetical protein MATR_36430 [Marivirga tractuosa]
MLRYIFQFALYSLVFTLMSCSDELDCNSSPDFEVDQSQLDIEIAEIESYLENNGIDYETDPSGIRYSVVESGTGAGPNFCSTVFVDYTATIIGDTRVFASGIDSQFPLRNSSVVPGFKLAVTNMNRNADYRVYVPASLLFVKGVSQTLPANLPVEENVEFRIRLVRY